MGRKQSSAKSKVPAAKAKESPPKDEEDSKTNKRLPKKQYKKWESYSDSLEAELAALGLKIKSITGDGNCFFRAVGDQLKGDEGLHTSLRHQVMEYVREHQEDFEPFIEDDEPFDRYVSRMRKDGMWAGNIELVAASQALKVNFTIYQAGQPRWTINNFDDTHTPQLHLSYHDGQHYNSVRVAGDPCTGPPLPVVLHGDGLLRRPAAAPGDTGFSDRDVQRVSTSTACSDLNLVRWALKEAYGDCDLAIEKVIDRLAQQAEEEPADSDGGPGDPVLVDPSVPEQQPSSPSTVSTSCRVEVGEQTPGQNSSPMVKQAAASDMYGVGDAAERQLELHAPLDGASIPDEQGQVDQVAGDAQVGDARGTAVRTSKVKVKKVTIGKKDKAPAPNKPCPCGSKKKYKKCCGDVVASKPSAVVDVVVGQAAQVGAISI